MTNYVMPPDELYKRHLSTSQQFSSTESFRIAFETAEGTFGTDLRTH